MPPDIIFLELQQWVLNFLNLWARSGEWYRVGPWAKGCMLQVTVFARGWMTQLCRLEVEHNFATKFVALPKTECCVQP